MEEGGPGIYALVAGTSIRKLKHCDDAGILYFGGSDNLHKRLRKTSEDVFDHSSLGWTLSWDEPAGEIGLRPIELPNGTVNKSNPKFPAFSKVDDPDLSQPALWVLPTPREKWKDLEKMLLMKHFFEFGQYPPFNADCPSIKSMYVHWKKRPNDKGWKEIWGSLGVDRMWTSLVEQVKQSQ